MTTLEFMGGGLIVDLESSSTGTWHTLGARHGLWSSTWSRNLVPVAGHVINFL